MDENKNLEKKAYTLLKVSSIISIIIVALQIFMVVGSFIIGPQDPNGGGWVMFFALMIAVFLLPYTVLAILHCVLYFISSSERKKNMPNAYGHAVASSVLGIFASIFFLIFALICFSLATPLVIPYIVCPVVATVYLKKIKKV